MPYANPMTPAKAAKYARQISSSALDSTPVADSPEDHAVATRAVNLDGDGVAYVEHIDGRVELTVKMRGRIQAALILSPAEASALGMSLARPGGPVLDDFFAVADAMHLDASQMLKGGAA